MPHLVQMDKRYGEKGLVVIGDECQGSSADQIEGVAKDARVEFPITNGTTRPEGMGGIPHAVVFNPEGKMVFSGHPMDDKFERAVKDALKEVEAEPEEDDDAFATPKPVIEERNWTNSDGKTIKAAILKIEGDSVVFLMGGREIPYAIDKLSEEDQELINKEAAEADEDADEDAEE